MTGAQEFAVDADQRLEPRPDRVRALRQRQLLGRTRLPPYAAIVHAAGLRATKILVEQRDRKTHAAQPQRGGAADQPAADHRDIGINAPRHAALRPSDLMSQMQTESA